MKAQHVLYAVLGYEVLAYLVNLSNRGTQVMPFDLLGAMIGYGTLTPSGVVASTSTGATPIAMTPQANFASGVTNVIQGVEGFVS